MGVPLFGREAQIRPGRTRVVGGVARGRIDIYLVGREAADSLPTQSAHPVEPPIINARPWSRVHPVP